MKGSFWAVSGVYGVYLMEDQTLSVEFSVDVESLKEYRQIRFRYMVGFMGVVHNFATWKWSAAFIIFVYLHSSDRIHRAYTFCYLLWLVHESLIPSEFPPASNSDSHARFGRVMDHLCCTISTCTGLEPPARLSIPEDDPWKSDKFLAHSSLDQQLP